MRCSKAQINISVALDGELDQASRAELARHLEGCSACERYQQDLEHCRLLLRESESAPSAQFEWKVQLGIAKALRERAVGELPSSERRFWLPAGLSAALTASVVLALGFWWLGSQEPSTSLRGEELVASSRGTAVQLDRNAPLRVFEQESRFRPHVVDSMPQLGRRARPDWRTPPSMKGQISTVNDLRMLSNETVKSHLNFGYRSYGLPPAASDSTSASKSPAEGR